MLPSCRLASSASAHWPWAQAGPRKFLEALLGPVERRCRFRPRPLRLRLRRKGPSVRLATGCTTVKHCAHQDPHPETSSTSCPVCLESLPSEILLKILSYLDAVTLLCTGCVNWRFYHLANDKISGLGWVIILREKSGREYVMEHVDLSINDSSVTILWFGRDWPRLATLSTLDLCGVMPVFMDQSKTPTKNGPRSRAVEAVVLPLSLSCPSSTRESLSPCAFNPGAPDVFLPVDVVVLSGRQTCLLSVRCGQHRTLSRSACPPILSGRRLMVILLTYYVDYVDPEGRVHMELVWIEETEEYFIVSLVLYLSVAKINRWFGTKY
ncbi:hypothetical protein CB1_001033012 [Camelus ferus]|nr:hypothetical protein CB1_001033012 [Camelus ferus]